MASFFKSAFEKLSMQQQDRMATAMEITAMQLSPGGELFGVFVQMRDYLKIIAEGGPKQILKGAKGAKSLGIGVQGIGAGMKLIAEALNAIPDGKEAERKMNAIVTGINMLQNMGKAILLFSASLALAFPLLLIGIPGLLLAIPMILAVGGLFYLMDKMNIERSIAKISTGLMLAGLAIVTLASAFLLTEMILSEVSNPWTSMAITAALVLGTALVFWVAGKFPMEIIKGAAAMAVSGLALYVLGWGAGKMLEAVPDFTTAMGMIGLIAGLGVTFALIGAYEAGLMTGIPLTITMGSIAMMAVGASLIVLSKGIVPMANAVSDLTLEQAGMIALIIAGLGIEFGIAGFAAPMIALGAGAFIVAGGALASVGAGLKSIVDIDFTALGTIDKKGTAPFNWSGQETSGFLGFFKRRKTNLEVAMEAIADSVSLGPLSILGIMGGAPALIMAGGALNAISEGLLKFQGLVEEIDLKLLTVNVALVTNVLADAFADIGKKYPGGGRSLFSLITGSTSGQSVVAQGISAVGGMGRALTGIAAGVQSMAELKFPIAWDSEGNPTKFRNLTTADFEAVGANTRAIITALSGTFAEIGESDAAQGSTWFSSSAYEKGFDVAVGMGSGLAGLATGVKEMAELKFPIKWDENGNPIEFRNITEDDMTKVGENTKALVLALSGTFSEIGESDAANDGGWFSSSSYEKGVELVSGFSEPLAKIASFVKDFTASKITDAQIEDMQRKTKAIIMGIARGFMFDSEGNQFAPWEISMAAESYGDMANSHKKITKSFGEMVENINDLDLEKVTEVRKMYDALASASNAEFNIVEEMGQSMLDAIELLAEKLSEFAGTVSSSAGSGSESTDGTAKGTGYGVVPGQNKKKEGAGEADDLLGAINSLRSTLAGTLDVYVTNSGNI